MSVDFINRRRFVGLFGGTLAAARLHAQPLLAAQPDFSFLFLTDSHLQPELNAVQGTALAMQRARACKADFAIQGGDHIMDALAVSKEKATRNFDLYTRTEQDLGLKVHHTLGNHDILGIYPASGVGEADPLYGKKMFAARFGPTYYTFDHKGVHFIVLDSVGITPDHQYEARIDHDQLDWLAADLAALRPGVPIVVSTHIPLVSAWQDYRPHDPKFPPYPGFRNGPAVLQLLDGHNVLAVLQGHTHINETVLWRGIPFITSGAVCGNWWHGPRWGVPEGFTVVTIAAGKLTTRYEPTGFQSIEPENS